MQSVLLGFLNTHQGLRALPLAARLEDMDTAALDGYNNIFINNINQILTRALTADICRLLECLGNRWIQLDYEILLESELVIALLDFA